jgi:hypothetical protein
MAIEIVSFPTKNGGFSHSYVSLPEGMCRWIVSYCIHWDLASKSAGNEMAMDHKDILIKWMDDKDRHSQTIFCWAVSGICTSCFFGGHAKAPKLEVERLVAVAPTGHDFS